MKSDNLGCWRPELRRAVMKARPDFFSWPVEQRERWGLAMPEQDRACFEEALLAELFGRVYATQADASAAADDLQPDERNLWNEVVLPLHGTGEDCFFLDSRISSPDWTTSLDTTRNAK